MDYLTGLNQCRRYNQTTTSGQMIFYIFIFLYLCFIFYILYVYIYTSSFYDQCRRYNQTKTSGQIFDVSLKVSHFNHTWPFFIGTLFAGSKPCTCLNWRLKTCSDWLPCLFICLFLVADSKDQGCLSSSGCLSSLLIYEKLIASSKVLCACIHIHIKPDVLVPLTEVRLLLGCFAFPLFCAGPGNYFVSLNFLSYFLKFLYLFLGLAICYHLKDTWVEDHHD